MSAACLSRLQCDRWLNGELADDVTAHVETCERCAAMVATHRDERAAFDPVLRRRRFGTWVVAASAAAAVLAICLLHQPAEPETRTKGKPVLGFYVKHRGMVREGRAGEIVAPGDVVDFTASIDRAAYLAILSVDGAGRTSVYYPADPMSAPLRAGQAQVLPLAVELDATLGIEHVRGVFCDRPVAVAELIAALPTGCVTDELILDKRVVP